MGKRRRLRKIKKNFNDVKVVRFVTAKILGKQVVELVEANEVQE